jgi:hypothetical protein
MDLGAVRRAISNYVSAQLPDLNCYPFPDPQPEYPALVLDSLDFVTFHATNAGGDVVQFTALLVVALPDVITATEQLESLLPVGLLIEQATDPSFVNIVSSQASNVRATDQGQALACDLTVTVHV